MVCLYIQRIGRNFLCLCITYMQYRNFDIFYIPYFLSSPKQQIYRSLFFALVRSVLECDMMIWHPYLAKDHLHIERVKNKFLLYLSRLLRMAHSQLGSAWLQPNPKLFQHLKSALVSYRSRSLLSYLSSRWHLGCTWYFFKYHIECPNLLHQRPFFIPHFYTPHILWTKSPTSKDDTSCEL